MSHGLLLVSDLQLLFNRGAQWVKDQINAGRLKAKRLGHKYIVTWEAVLEFINHLPDAKDTKPRRQHTKQVQKHSLPSA